MEKGLVTQGDDEVLYDSFHAMGLKEDLLRGIYAYGYTKPSPIQQRGIVPFNKGHDLILQGMKGPGRTSTYCIGVLQQLDIHLKKCQCLILASSSGEVLEIAAKIEALGKYLGVKVYASLDKEYNVPNDSHVVVGTLLRVHKLVTKQILHSEEIKILVLDEARFMMNFNNRVLEVNEIIKCFPLKAGNQLQICAFSEAFPTNILQSITKTMRYDHVVLLAKTDFEELTLKEIKKHTFVNVEKHDLKGSALREIIDKTQAMCVTPIVVFVESATKVLSLSNEMERYAYTCSVTRACMDQKDIDKITEEFLHKTGVLLTTSFWSRGIVEKSIHQVRFIVNYDLSAGAFREYLWTLGWFRGVDSAINFATRDDWSNLMDLQSTYDIVIEKLLPSEISTDFPQTSTVSTIKDAPIKHFLCNVGDEEEKVFKLLGRDFGLYGELAIARTTVIFVNSPEKLSWLVDKIELDNSVVLTSEDSLLQVVNDTRPRVFITTDQELDVKVKVHFVINFDVPLTRDSYYRRIGCCQSSGIFLLFGTKVDWFEVFNIQASYGAFFTWIPGNAVDILKQMILTEISPPSPKKVRTLT